MMAMHSAVGVDGCKAGWLACWRSEEGISTARYSSPADLWAVHRSTKAIAVDIPIGLSDTGRRQPDTLARDYVGGRRACSVFSAPVRGILDAKSQKEASARHRAIDGRGFGVQSFGILDKVRAWDEFVRTTISARVVIKEVHPEVCFAAMSGGYGLGLEASKKSPIGQRGRVPIFV